ncbi:MAG TPA: tRNA(His) guanylyltransferase Thg1 family protein [Urbifossiella sp.]|nr:tRNA(His) guanylyltransferase Thg1 family protein [Urbifossiella sp.]
MRPDEFEARMRRLECFHALRCPDGAWVVLRLDGRGFTRFTEAHCEKPFDDRFHGWMLAAARAVFEDFGGVYAYTESDEVSVLLPRGWAHFDREVEKAVSVSAGLASAAFALACGASAHFDCRVVVVPTDEQVVDYFRWRQADAARCALNGWCYWTLRKEGLDARAATRKLAGLTVADKNELLFRRGVNFNDLPAWQKRGAGLTWEVVPHAGRNPLTGEAATATRRRVRVDRELPTGDGYAAWVSGLLTTPPVADAEPDPAGGEPGPGSGVPAP